MIHPWLRKFAGLVCLAVAWPAAGELMLTNFSVANPIKVMCVGDSITDDCVFNGAWRSPLQVLLNSSGIPFTNVGRYASTAEVGFTQRQHEGFCGAVVAPPGAFGPVHGYASADNYLLKIVADALSVPGNQPDLMLVLIGANDLGRGRNPHSVATNDMAGLLNLIRSNAPHANVLLAKTATLRDATAGYGVYATNVPIYNADLQALVNQRRAAGQNVFLADMFTAVDYATMFLSDHLHPNPAGLQAIAKEWAARIETVCVSTTRFAATLVPGGSSWNYSDSGADLGTAWAQTAYDDSSWPSGLARLGYGDPAVATTISFGPDPLKKHPTAYFRHAFVVPPDVVITNLNFRLARSDGAAVWLNGQELFRANLPGGALGYTNLALAPNTGFAAHFYYPTNLPIAGLPSGTNLLAVEIHTSSPANPRFGFDLEMIAAGPWLPPPGLSIARVGNGLRLSWPALAGAGYALHATTNLTAPAAWTPVSQAALTNAGQVVVLQDLEAGARYYRLQRP